MMPGIDPRAMRRMMEQMGIKSTEIKAKRVVIEKEDGKIIISEPAVTMIDMAGQRSFQVVGSISEEQGISDEDVRLVVDQTGASREEAEKTLRETGGDIAEAIMRLKK